MKKLFLMLGVTSIALSSNAQQNANVMLQDGRLQVSDYCKKVVTDLNPHVRQLKATPSSDQKTTTLHTTNNSSWFNFWEQNDQGATSTLYYFNVAEDSNILDNSGTSAYHFWMHGMGMSFDPTDAMYYTAANTIQITATPIIDTTSYKVDSFFTVFQYIRNNNTDTLADSIIVELCVTSLAADSGTYKLRFNASAANTAITSDSTPRFASANYTRIISPLGPSTMWDSIKTQKQRYAFGLKLADTVGGIRALNFGLTSPLNCGRRAKVVSFVHFKSRHATTLGSSTIANSNYIKLYGGTTEGDPNWPQQTAHSTGYAGSYQTGLVAPNQIRYRDTGFTYQGHQMLIPGVAYTDPFAAVTWQAFHVMWTAMQEDAVANVNNTISGVSAYPNPANNTVNVTFNVATATDVKVTLTNIVGEVVDVQTLNNVNNGKATFNTSALPAGVYMYSVTANGERSTGKIDIAH